VTTALTIDEGKRLATIETMIERGFKSFVESGKALAVVRDEKLYRASYKTFDEYCKGRWGLERSYADRLIKSAEVVNRIVDKTTPMGVKTETATLQDSRVLPVPTNERQTRELAKAPKDEQAEVWQEVVATTAVPTAAVVKAVVEKRKKAKAKPDTVSDPKPKVFKRDAPMPEWYADDNRVAVPVELYPVWRAKKEYARLSQELPSFELCESIRALGQSLDHAPTIAFADDLKSQLMAMCESIRKSMSSLQPSVVTDGKWLSRSEVEHG
jgi:hypothetical protein